jgi:putative lysine transport system permease protein
MSAERSFFGWVVFILENYGDWFVKGAGVTMLIAITSTIAGFFIGMLIGIVRTIPKSTEKRITARIILLWVVNSLLNVYVEVFRGTPMIVQAMIIYYGLAEMFSIMLNPITAGIIIVSINTGAYMAEIVRGGIESIDKGQTEAARAIGMNHTKTMINVILPQAIRNILPATGNEFVINIKDTAVLNVITVVELFFTARTIRGAMFRTYEVFFITAAIYLFLTFTVTRLLRLLERKLDGPEGYTIYNADGIPDKRLNRRKDDN